MSFSIYLSLDGKKQGPISQGCGGIDSIGNKAQTNHLNKILVNSCSFGQSRLQNVIHHAVVIKKLVDKSSPLLGMAISENELLQAILEFYRINSFGIMEFYYSIQLVDVFISEYTTNHPNTITHTGGQPEETLSLLYKSITWKHHIAGTSGYSIWDERVF